MLGCVGCCVPREQPALGWAVSPGPCRGAGGTIPDPAGANRLGETRLSGRSWDHGVTPNFCLLILHLEWKMETAEPCLAELLGLGAPLACGLCHLGLLPTGWFVGLQSRHEGNFWRHLLQLGLSARM